VIGQLIDLLGGWKEVRASMGFSYQIGRSGKRRVVPIEGYRNRGLADTQWAETGVFADDGLSERYREFSYIASKQPKRVRPAQIDFALNE
jgi:hypothetical protein